MGIQDFSAYWSASKLLIKGANPFNNAAIEKLKLEAGNECGAYYVWNPPWTFLIIAPFTTIPLAQASSYWLFLNVSLLIISGLIILGLYELSATKKILIILASIFLCTPALHTLWVGQLSILLTFVCACLYRSLIKERDFLVGILLFCLSIKLHLFYLFIAIFLCTFLRHSRYRFIPGIVLSAVLVIGYTAWINPISIKIFFLSPSIPKTYLAVTVVTPVRLLLSRGEQLPLWPIWLIPLLTMGLAIFGLYRMEWKFSWKNYFVPLLALSFFTSPYGWFFDFAPLFIGNIIIIARAMADIKSLPFVIVALVILEFCVSVPAKFIQNCLFWYPLAYLILWIGIEKIIFSRNMNSKVL